MGWFNFELEEFGMMAVIFILLTSFANGSGIAENPLLWAPALIISVPVKLFTIMSQSSSLLAPFAIIAFYFYLQFAKSTLGSAVMGVVTITSAVVLSLSI